MMRPCFICGQPQTSHGFGVHTEEIVRLHVRGRRAPIVFDRYEANCGTRQGYLKHQRRNETACLDCKRAHAAYMRKRNG